MESVAMYIAAINHGIYLQYLVRRFPDRQLLADYPLNHCCNLTIRLLATDYW
jgi:hypothetical protein